MKDGIPWTQLRHLLAPFDAGVSVNGVGRPAASGEIGVLKVSCVRDGLFLPDENKAVVGPEVKRVAVSPTRGTILITRANTPDLIGACGLVDRDYPHLFLSDKIWLTRPIDRTIDDADYIVGVLCSDQFREAIRVRATGTSAGMKNISKRSFLAIQVPRPSIKLQQKYGLALRRFAQCEACVTRLLMSRRRLRRALLQQLLSGSMRFAHASGAWKRTALGDITSELSTRNRGGLGAERVMGVLKHEGLVPMRERTMADDLGRYKVVPPRSFAYNPMRINIGSIAYSWHKHDVLVSPDYEVFATRPDRLDPRYLDHLRHSEAWASFVKRAGNGSVRVRIYYQDLGQFVFPLPPLREQQRIAALLDKLDHEIALLERQLAAYRQLKRGLMQTLLTGDISHPTTQGSTAGVYRHD